MKSIKISIAPRHIRCGTKGSMESCPIALAIKEALLTDNVKVDGSGIFINERKYEVDKKDLRFIERFDNGERVSPYSFELTRPMITRRG